MELAVVNIETLAAIKTAENGRMNRSAVLLCYVLALLACVAERSHHDVPTVTLVEKQRIGSVHDSLLVLTRVGGVAVAAAQQRLYVGQPQDAIVKIFTLDGQYVGSIGGSGGGPGEFSSPGAIGVIGDTIWVLDAMTGRLTYFAASGRVVKTLSFEPIEHEGVRLRGAGAPMIDGGYLAVAFSIPAQAFGLPKVPLVKRTADGTIAGTLARFAAPVKGGLRLARPGGGVRYMTLPLSDAGFYSRAPDGSGVMIVEELTDVEAIQVVRIEADGDTALAVRVPFNPIPLSARYVDSTIGEISKLLQGIETDFEPIREGLRRFKHFPAVTAAVLGEDGVIWIRREDVGAATVAWDVLKPDGRSWFRAHLPNSARVQWAKGDSIWAMVLDSLDVPYLVRLRAVH